MADHDALKSFLTDVAAAAARASALLDTPTPVPTPSPTPTPDPVPTPTPPPSGGATSTEIVLWGWDSGVDHAAWKAAGGGGMVVTTNARVGSSFPTNFKPMSDAFHAVGLKSYYGFYWENFDLGGATPLGDIWNDTVWASNVAWFASLAKQVIADGWDGIAPDAENYPVATGANPSWNWQTAAQGHSEADTRAKMKQRGADVGRTLTGVKRAIVYGSKLSAGLPGGWNEQLQLLPGNSGATYADSLWVDFLAGLFSTWQPDAWLMSGWCETGQQGPGSFDQQLAFDRDGQLATAQAHFPATMMPKLGFGGFYSCGPVDANPAKGVTTAVAQMTACARHADGLIVEYLNKGSAATGLATYTSAYQAAAPVASGLVRGTPAGPLVNPRLL